MQSLTMLHIYVETVILTKLLKNKSLNIYNYQVKLLLLHVVAYICYNCYFFVLLRNNSFNIHNYL